MDIFSYIFSEGTWFGIIDNGILVFVSLFGVNLERKLGGEGVYGALFGALLGNALSDGVAAIIDPSTRMIAGGIFAGCMYVVVLAYIYVKVAKPDLDS